MIIQGQVLTDNGPVDIKNLKPGDRVLNQLHRAYTVKKVQTKTVSGAYIFNKNPNLLVAKGVVLKTIYGNKKVSVLGKTAVYMAQPNMRMVKDTVSKKTGEYTAYEIKTDGCDSVFVSNYCLKMEDENA